MASARSDYRAYATMLARAPRASTSPRDSRRRDAARWVSDGTDFAMRAPTIDERVARCVECVETGDDDAEARYEFCYAVMRERGARHCSREAATACWRETFARERDATTRDAMDDGEGGARANANDVVDAFVSYVRDRRDVTVITADAWSQAYQFVRRARALGGDLRWYDENEAWPSLFDEFVEFAREAMGSAAMRAETTASGRGDDARRVDAFSSTAFASATESRKRRVEHVAEARANVVGLTREFERELAVGGRAPKRVCSDMDLGPE